MRIILSSDDRELRDILNSYEFSVVNCKSVYTNDGNFAYTESVLKELPRVGEFLYFTDNYYQQIAVEVVRIAKNPYKNLAVVYLRRVSLRKCCGKAHPFRGGMKAEIYLKY